MVEPLINTHPELVMSLWDYKLNSEEGTLPEKVSKGSTKRAWWVCENEGHSWNATISSVVRGSRCSYCSGKSVLVGFNDLATTDPQIVKILWDEPANEKAGIMPTSVTRSSGKKANWSCATCGNSWESRVVDVVRGYGCAVCGNSRIVAGINDLFTKRPDLYSPYSHTLNTEVDPSALGVGSNTKAWWNCPEGHSYLCSVSDVCKGVGCGVCRGLQVVPGVNDLATAHPEIVNMWDYEKNGALSPTMISPYSGRRAWVTCRSGHSRYAYVPDIFRYDCGRCSKSTSAGENDLAEFIESAVPGNWEVQRNNRNLIPPREVDIYIPNANLAIEYNGVFFHSDFYQPRAGVDSNKARDLREAGIGFMAVWEDDWASNREVVERTVLRKLGIVENKVYARQCEVFPVDAKSASKFLNNNHIQGKKLGTDYLGLHYKNELVGVTVLTKRTPKEAELSRYATSSQVVGGMSKILKYIENNLPYTGLVTFADLSVSDGGMYVKTGWSLDKEIPPDYSYLPRGGTSRENKRSYRIKRFRDDPTLNFEEGMTEKALAEMNGLTRVYDYGKIKYRLDFAEESE